MAQGDLCLTTTAPFSHWNPRQGFSVNVKFDAATFTSYNLIGVGIVTRDNISDFLADFSDHALTSHYDKAFAVS